MIDANTLNTVPLYAIGVALHQWMLRIQRWRFDFERKTEPSELQSIFFSTFLTPCRYSAIGWFDSMASLSIPFDPRITHFCPLSLTSFVSRTPSFNHLSIDNQMAEYDLTAKLGRYFDRHLVFPLLEFLTERNVSTRMINTSLSLPLFE